MTAVRDLLDPYWAARLREVAQVTAQTQQVNPFTGKPSASAPVREATVIDERSEALVEVPCGGGCGVTVLTDPTVAIPPEYAHLPRITMCRECAKDEVAGKSGVVVHTPRVKRHAPRLEATEAEHRSADAKRKPRKATTRPKEATTMQDITEMNDADLGALVRASVLADLAANTQEAAPKAAKAKKAKAKKAAKEHKAGRQAARQGGPLPAFRVDAGLTVEALDLSGPDNLDELAHATARRPYNQARYRLLGEPALDPETTTWKVILGEHMRLRLVAERVLAERAAKAAAKAKPAKAPAKKKGKGKKAALAAQVGDDVRVGALMTTLDISREQALAVLSA
jgi:hypothetical protein